MLNLQEVSAEQLAKLFHHYREALAHDGDNREEACAWDHAPQQERRVMVAAARLTLLELSTPNVPTTSDRKYFAKPGEADWGC